jgi:hypothetical protein
MSLFIPKEIWIKGSVYLGKWNGSLELAFPFNKQMRGRVEIGYTIWRLF